jgi:hypothetical protein
VATAPDKGRLVISAPMAHPSILILKARVRKLCLPVCGTSSSLLDRWAMLGQLDAQAIPLLTLRHGVLPVPVPAPGPRPHTIGHWQAGIDAPIQLRPLDLMFDSLLLLDYVFCTSVCSFSCLGIIHSFGFGRLCDLEMWDPRLSLSRRYLGSSDLITSSRLC